MFRQAVRGDHKLALETFEKIKERNLQPNYQSLCIHAKSCNNLKHAEEIFQQIEESNMKVNAFLLRSLVAAAVQHRLYKVKGYEGLRYPDFYYLVYLIKQLKKHGVKANIQIIHLFETVAFYAEKYNRWTCQDKEYERRINSFRKAYNEWLRTTDAIDAAEAK
uniref:Uncharacterized protein n=1 Tax=Ciona savignyi TaxID=51511 RepID=H2ZG53_CIOSA